MLSVTGKLSIWYLKRGTLNSDVTDFMDDFFLKEVRSDPFKKIYLQIQECLNSKAH